MADWIGGQRPYILGHRGASHDARENTLAAFALALAQGADGIELDVQLTRDGGLIVYHDAHLKPETGRQGRIASLTTAELQALDLGDGQHMPTLDQVFATLGPQALYNVEIKDWTWPGQKAGELVATAVADCIHTHNLARQCHVSSFNPFCLRRIRRHLTPTTSTGILREAGLWRFGHLLTPSEADHPHHSMIDARYMAWARRRGWRVYTWTVDDPAEAQRLARLGVDGIITNKPAVIRAALA